MLNIGTLLRCMTVAAVGAPSIASGGRSIPSGRDSIPAYHVADGFGPSRVGGARD